MGAPDALNGEFQAGAIGERRSLGDRGLGQMLDAIKSGYRRRCGLFWAAYPAIWSASDQASSSRPTAEPRRTISLEVVLLGGWSGRPGRGCRPCPPRLVVAARSLA